MIKFPVFYDSNDESVQDAEFAVIAHPFIQPGMTAEDKHEIGVKIALALNGSQGSGEAERPAAQGQNGFHVTAFIRSLLSDRERKMLDRKERALKKYVAKLAAKHLAPKEAA